MSAGRGFCDLGFAKIDTGRLARKGFPEVVYCPGKDKAQIKQISKLLAQKKQDLLLTRLEQPVYRYLKKYLPRLRYNKLAKLGYALQQPKAPRRGNAVVISAGTADAGVAEEAAATLEIMANNVTRLYDVGVAGIHRLMDNLEIIKKAKVIVVVAGMEGALASIVSGLVKIPVIAVPTSCGYGANFHGLSALLTMLNSCSPGITVVNIDNGFGAGYFASLINR